MMPEVGKKVLVYGHSNIFKITEVFDDGSFTAVDVITNEEFNFALSDVKVYL